jgi:4-hydroxy-3-methylbut-2-enyl diphosphate reductase
MAARFGPENLASHFADTSDTLCYATNENQNATYAVIERGADIALVVGGYNSSNTSHIVELCREKLPTYFIQNETEILSEDRIRHFSLEERIVVETAGWLPSKRPVEIILTCGASCPDAVLDEVLARVHSLLPGARPLDEVLEAYVTREISPPGGNFA